MSVSTHSVTEHKWAHDANRDARNAPMKRHKQARTGVPPLLLLILVLLFLFISSSCRRAHGSMNTHEHRCPPLNTAPTTLPCSNEPSTVRPRSNTPPPLSRTRTSPQPPSHT